MGSFTGNYILMYYRKQIKNIYKIIYKYPERKVIPKKQVINDPIDIDIYFSSSSFFLLSIKS